MTASLVQADLELDWGDLVAVIALGFSAYVFYDSLIRAPRIEQMRMGWDRWEAINEKYNEISKLKVGEAPETKLSPI